MRSIECCGATMASLHWMPPKRNRSHHIFGHAMRIFCVIACVACLLTAGCAASRQGDDKAALAAAVAEFEAVCRQQAARHLDKRQADSLCRCVAENHRLQLHPDELRLLIRDYRGEFSEDARLQNNDLNQLAMHDALVAEACLENPSFRAGPRAYAAPWERPGRARMTASAP